jgi:4-hydroxybenzoate polyprenyltransferase
MIVGLRHYLAGSYPPVPSILFATAWAVGVSGLYAVVDPQGAAWRPDAGLAIAALTLALDLLLMRILDDIRDRDYDRLNDPKRPLPRGVVSIAQLLAWCAGLVVAIVAINWTHPGRFVIVGQLAYAALVMIVYERWHWPRGDRLLLSLLINCPIQILLHLYLYAGYLHGVGHAADHHGLLALAVVMLASVHLEAAKKIVRTPRPGERTYVRVFGLGGTVGIAMAAVGLSSCLLLTAIATRWSAAGILVMLAPLVLPLLALQKFRRPEERWRAKYAAYYLLLTFCTYGVGGVWLTGREGQLFVAMP